MVGLVLQRLLVSLVSLLAVSILIFWALQLLPGDTAQAILGRNATPNAVAVLRQELHLNQPPVQRYFTWLTDFVRGDWGTSLASAEPVTSYVGERLRNTLILAGFALALYVPLSLALGILTAARHGGFVDTVSSVLLLMGMAVPEFVVAILLLYVFGVLIPVVPPLSFLDQAQSFGDVLQAVALPSLALTAGMTAYAVRLMRESMIEVLQADYVVMARLKGLPPRTVFLRHALPHALGPALNVTALNIAWLIGGIVVVETIFDYPGLGRLLVDSITYRDVPVIEAIAIILSAIYIAANLLADIASLLLNPRLRTS